MKNPSVSIVIPVYNVQDYIVKCLDSVAAQTYTGSMECLIIDDCGTDDSIRLAEQFVKQYNGHIDFHIIHHEYNKGLSGARNTGIKEAQGDWLYFLDSDDWIIPECIEMMLNKTFIYPETELVQAGTICEKDWLRLKEDMPEYSQDREWLKKSFLKDCYIPVTAWNKLLKKQWLIENGLFFKEGIIHEDELFAWYLAKIVSHMCFLQMDTYYYTERSESIMNSPAIQKKHFMAMTNILEECIEGIDMFCHKEQIFYILSKMKNFPYEIRSKRENKCFCSLLKRLSSKTRGIRAITLYLYAISPLWMKRKHRYNFLILDLINL